MVMDQLEAFADEMLKIAGCKKLSPFMQSRRGRRPIRVEKALQKVTAYLPSKVAPGDPVKTKSDPKEVEAMSGREDPEVEHGQGIADGYEKVGKVLTRERKEKAIGAFARVRPYVASGVKAGVPAAVMTKMLLGEGGSDVAKKRGSRIVRTVGLLGAGAGMANRALKEWAARHKRKGVAKEILKEGSAEMRKIAAMAGDLRMKGLGGVPRPPFPTEGSKSLAFNKFRNASKPGAFQNVAKPKTLIKPGPSIKMVSAAPNA